VTAAPLPPGIRLRPATREDAGRVRSLILRVRINPMSLDWENFLLAEDGRDGLVGCGQVKTHADGSRELASIAVEDAWRKHGIASRLVTELQVRHGLPLWLTCQSALIGFYANFGFSEVAETVDLPPYFRKILRLARIFKWMAPGERLAIMLWKGPSPGDPA
jgi:N-acetylglutamate synthase-like GNAT family acetyltransferase